MFRGDLQNTGRFTTSVSPTGNLLTTFPTGNSISSTAVISPQGTVYVGSNDGRLYALTLDGVKLWEFDTTLPDRTSYVVASPAIAPDGTQKWRFVKGLRPEPQWDQ